MNNEDGLTHHKTLADLERGQKTNQKIHVIKGAQKVTRFVRKFMGIPEPHDRFTPYEQLTVEERHMRVERIRKQNKRKSR